MLLVNDGCARRGVATVGVVGVLGALCGGVGGTESCGIEGEEVSTGVPNKLVDDKLSSVDANNSQ